MPRIISMAPWETRTSPLITICKLGSSRLSLLRIVLIALLEASVRIRHLVCLNGWQILLFLHTWLQMEWRLIHTLFPRWEKVCHRPHDPGLLPAHATEPPGKDKADFEEINLCRVEVMSMLGPLRNATNPGDCDQRV